MRHALIGLITALVTIGITSGASAENQVSAAKSTNIAVTTFNIRFYGLGGDMKGKPSDEKRDSSLKQFIAQYIPKSDFFIFQEIVDVERLVNKVLPVGFDCISYDHADSKHQHVVLCHSGKYSFKADPADPDSIIQEISVSDRSRPAVHTLVLDNSGQVLFRLVGVHLKAYPEESQTRQKQVQALAKFFDESPTQVPIVVGGDFNTYPKNLNQQKNDDDVLFSQIFADYRLNLHPASNDNDFTFRKGNMRSNFDRFWMTGNAMKQIKPMDVYTVCNEKGIISAKGVDFSDPNTYYNSVSDHCPVTLTFQVK